MMQGDPARAGNVLLSAADVTVAWGGVRALDGVSLRVGAGEIVGLIGPNGAGKTTLINVLTGYVKPATGSVHLDGQEITRLAPQRRARRGLIRTFQDVRMFTGLTTEESVLASAEAGGLRRSAARRRVSELLESLELREVASMLSENVAYGEQRRLAIARALAPNPKVLLLDEPAAGLNDVETQALGDVIAQIPAANECGVLLIEHNIALVTAVCDWLHVLDHGAEIFRGIPRAAFDDTVVRDAYIGHGFSARANADQETGEFQ